ncbi:MAG: ABC transporter substrate-binding protein [Candidatus Gracilibacteria bacterium]
MFRDFFRTIRSYTFGEKITSAMLLVVFVLSGWGAIHASPGAGDNSTYVEGTVGRILVLNPLFVNFNDVDRDVGGLIFSGLLKYDASKGKMVEDLATMSLNDTQTVYTFTIRDGVYFHNGKPVTADDIYFTYHDLIQSEDFSNAALRANFDGVTITKKDARTVQFQISQPNSFFLTNFSIGILPKSVYEKVPPGDLLTSDLNKNPVGSGPYKVSDGYILNSRGDGKLSLSRFDKYYGGLPHVKQIVIRTYASSDRLLANISDLDAVSKVSGDLIAQLKDTKFTLHPYELPQYRAAFFNTSRPFVKERSVRFALEKSLNKEDLLKQLPSKVGVDTPFMELDQQEWSSKSDIAAARLALSDAGYKYDNPKNPDVRKDKKGTPLAIRVVYFQKSDKNHGTDEDEITAQFLKKSWEDIGINVQLEPHSPEERADIVSQHDYDVLLTGESLGYDLDTYFFWHSSQATDGGSNLSNYRNFSADALIEDIRRYVDEDRKSKRLVQLAKTVSGDIPAAFLYRPVYFYATDDKFKGYVLTHLAFAADRFFNIQLWQ